MSAAAELYVAGASVTEDYSRQATEVVMRPRLKRIVRYCQ